VDASPTEQAAVDAVRALLRAALALPGGLCVLTGAGMSAESGIATFRDALTGLWARFDPAELASEEGFRAHPQRVWDWYAERRVGMGAALPNAGHLALAEFDRRHPGVLALVTQNVDDLHQRAGVERTIRLHGDILADRWLDPCPRAMACETDWAGPGRPPRCAECGNLVRPGVVWFGEMLPVPALEAAERAAQGCRVMLVVGTSGAVWPAAGLVGQARRRGAAVVVLNPHPSEIDDEAGHLLRGTAATLLPRLLGDLDKSPSMD
jgi:NAD-dependent deacetylase